MKIPEALEGSMIAKLNRISNGNEKGVVVNFLKKWKNVKKNLALVGSWSTIVLSNTCLIN